MKTLYGSALMKAINDELKMLQDEAQATPLEGFDSMYNGMLQSIFETLKKNEAILKIIKPAPRPKAPIPGS